MKQENVISINGNYFVVDPIIEYEWNRETGEYDEMPADGYTINLISDTLCLDLQIEDLYDLINLLKEKNKK